jgi:beta-N-acetylhexosaminidase
MSRARAHYNVPATTIAALVRTHICLPMLVPRDIRRHIGQLVMVGFDGPTLSGEVGALAKEFDLAGAILFARNVQAPDQVAELAHDIERLATDLPLWVGVDQEGGRVARLRAPFTEWPPMATLGRAGDQRLAARFAEALAREIAAVGITLDFAPVLDVHTNPANPVIGDRALADRADVVARLGRTIVETLQANGLAACGKHFPGHGDTSVDSHHALPVVEHPLERLRQVELVPFRAAVEADVAAIMTAHVLLPALDERNPATMSPRIVRELLRDELRFDGLVVSDDLDMKAVAAERTLADAAVAAIGAGCDMVLLCSPDPAGQAAALEALLHAVEDERLPVRRVEDAIARQRRAKARFLGERPPAIRTFERHRALVGRGEHRAIAEEMARFL